MTPYTRYYSDKNLPLSDSDESMTYVLLGYM
ncbi:unnamed protein product, partial [Didymodactylos carnosus]